MAKTYIADSYHDGRFGSQRGEQAQEPRKISATSPMAAFKKAFGFRPSAKRLELGTGYRYVNERGESHSAECYRIRESE